MTQFTNLCTAKQRKEDPARHQRQHNEKRNQVIECTQHCAVFSTGRSVIIIGRSVPSIGSEHVRVCVWRMVQGIVDDQEEDIDIDVGIVQFVLGDLDRLVEKTVKGRQR